MSNKPVAWMLNGILHECDPSDWAKEQYPDQDVIPLYTHPVKELPNNHQYIAQLEMIVRNQQAEIEALKGEYDKLYQTAKEQNMKLINCQFDLEYEKRNRGLDK